VAALPGGQGAGAGRRAPRRGPLMPAVMTGYRFVPLTGLAALRDALERDAAEAGLKGTILLAEEGINATLAGRRDALERFHAALTARPPFAGLEVRFS